MELIDTHCHIDVDAFDKDRHQVLEHCRALGIRRLVVPAITANSWKKLLDLCEKESGLYPALGLHPIYIDQHEEADIDLLKRAIEQSRPIAVGEIGLDYYLKELDRIKQQDFFEEQLEIALKADLPVLLHIRKAYDAVLASLKKIGVKGGIAHAFNGSEQQARQFIDLGFKLGFGGTMTYDGSKKIHHLARSLPLEAIVLETDAPDMVVAQHRGERNSPEYLIDCLHALAGLRRLDPEVVAERITQNALEVLNLSC